VTTLTDEQVTVDALLRALDGLAQMKPEDMGVVVLAGHGVKPSPHEDMVFLTSSSEATAESVRATGVGWKAIGGRLAAAKGRLIVLLDACHSGHVTQALIVPNNDLAGSLVREQRAGTLVFAAAKGRQLSYEPSGARGLELTDASKPLVLTNEEHGLFTGAILRALADQETDHNGNGAIEASELVDEVSTRVARASNGKQTPWVVRRELFGDFSVATLPGTSGLPQGGFRGSIEPSPSNESARRSGEGSIRKPAGYVIAAVGLAGLGVAAYTGVALLHDKSAVNDHCDASKHCDSRGMEAVSSINTLKPWNAASWVVGVLGLGFGGYLILTSPKSTLPYTTVGWAQNANGASIVLTGGF
jgi:hypothetical protein